MDFDPRFKERMIRELGIEEWRLFESAAKQSPPVSVRLHPRKYSGTLETASEVPWCRQGRYLDRRPVFTLDPAFHAGGYYVQEASSMSLWYILDKIAKDKETLAILDLCGAPGGKSTLIAEWLDGKGILVSNEVIRSRSQILKQNLMKSGYDNIIVTQNDPADWGEAKGLFDIIVTDAPCSGEGMFRKDPKAMQEWSESNVHHCSLRQKRIVEDVLPVLKQDGMMIYSTCTFNHEENIDNIEDFCKRLGLQSMDIGLDNFENVSRIRKNEVTGYQFYPHKIKGEGFFVAVMQRSGTVESPVRHPERYFTFPAKMELAVLESWVIPGNNIVMATDKTGTIHAMSKKLHDFTRLLPRKTRIINAGIAAGQLNKEIFIPDHHLALSFMYHPQTAAADLDKADALLYLKKELQQLAAETKGWILIKYNNTGLGWCKNLGNRINNYLPNEWRIRMDLDVSNS